MGKATESVVFGTVALTWNDYPDWMKHEIEDSMAPSVTRQLRKANKQIRDTQTAIKWDTSYGIVAFVVPSGFNVDPWVIGRITWNQLIRRQGHFPHVDAVIVVTVPVEDQAPTRRPPIFVPLTRRNEAIPHKLSGRIRDSWLNHFARKTGEPVYAIGATEEAFMRMQQPIKLKFEM